MLTYADVQRIYRLEKNSTSLQNIPDNFYEDLRLLLSKIGEEHRSYIKKITQELYEKRKQKILLHAMKDEEPANLTHEEKKLYQEIMELLENYANRVLFDESLPRVKEERKIEEAQEEQKEGEIKGKEEIEEIQEEQKEIGGEDKTKSDEKPDTIKLKILEELPSIVGFNSISYGPFQKNQEIMLPEKIAKILIERRVAEYV